MKPDRETLRQVIDATTQLLGYGYLATKTRDKIIDSVWDTHGCDWLIDLCAANMVDLRCGTNLSDDAFKQLPEGLQWLICDKADEIEENIE